MKKIKIGIPRAFHYYRYGALWKTFFEYLGCKVIISPDTNQEILNLGINNTIDECCLSYKIYIGHVLYLKDKCDYILIPRICDYGKKEKVCTRFNGIYDDLKLLIPKYQILSYNIEHTKHKYQVIGLIKTALKFTKNPIKIIYSYYKAKNKQIKYDKNRENENKNKLLKLNKKILIISHFYNLQDKYISNYIIKYLEKNNILTIFSNYLDKKIAKKFAEYFSNTIYWKYSQEMMGALYYYKYQVDGIIFISTYPCGIDSLVNNLAIYKNKQIPILNLNFDENITELSLETKLESFIDIIKGVNNE